VATVTESVGVRRKVVQFLDTFGGGKPPAWFWDRFGSLFAGVLETNTLG
jgi:hypothetical protein